MLFSCTFVSAQEAQSMSIANISRATMIGIGTTNRLDTYLSPLNYTGNDIRFISSVLREKHSGWDTQLLHDGGIDYTKNPSANGHTLSGHYDFSYGMMHRWTLLDGNLTLRAGGMAEIYGGFAYNMRNSANNPAQGYVSLHIGGTGMAHYSTPFRISNRNISVGYEARLPLIGCMFSPDYGQSYYEIFERGDYDGNIVLNTIATPSLRQTLYIDLPLSNDVAVRVGYLNDIRQATPNNLRQHTYTHAAILGVVRKL